MSGGLGYMFLPKLVSPDASKRCFIGVSLFLRFAKPALMRAAER